jgi:hypothetical protein
MTGGDLTVFASSFRASSSSSFTMDDESSDSDASLYMTATERLEHYLALPQLQIGGAAAAAAAADQDDEEMPGEEDAEETFDQANPIDYWGAPIPEKWVDIPLDPEDEKIISIKIKRVAFIRQKVRTLSVWPKWTLLKIWHFWFCARRQFFI